MPDIKEIYCCGCGKKMDAYLVSGLFIYNTHKYSDKWFYQCAHCKNYVGCHPGTKKQLGCIPTPVIRNARKIIHSILDPIFKSGKIKRRKLYKLISDKIGFNYHTANLRTIEECRKAYKIIIEIDKEIT